MSRERRRARRDDENVSRMLGPRSRFVRSGRIRRESSMSGVSRSWAGSVTVHARRATAAGEVRTRKKVLITVPPGADTGSKIRLKGQGGKGSANGPPGDLLITFNVLPDKFYQREGLDVIAMVPFNIAQATLGSKVSVNTLDGKKVVIRIPPGTASGKKVPCARAGNSRREAKHGDLIVEVKIEAPEKLSEEQQRIMKEFAAAGGMKY